MSSTPYTLVDESDEGVVRFLAAKAGIRVRHPESRIIGFRDRDGIRGAFYFEGYTGVRGSIRIHWAGRDPRWLTSYMLTMVALYVFVTLECEVAFGEVKSTALSVRRIDEKIGFREVARVEGYYPADDMILYALRKNECVWLPDEFKEVPDGAGQQRA